MEPTSPPRTEAEPTAETEPSTRIDHDDPTGHDTARDEGAAAQATIDEGGEAPCWAHLDIIEN